MHVVMISHDHGLLDSPNGRSDTVRRHTAYADLLRRKVASACLSIIVLHSGEPRDHGTFCAYPAGTGVRGLVALWWRLVDLQQTSPISLITTQSLDEEAWMALAFARRHHIPVIGQVHYDIFAVEALSRNPIWQVVLRTRKWLSLRLIRRYAGLRVVSSGLKRQFENLNPNGYIEVIPVPMPMLANARPAPLAEPSVCFVGELAERKGLDTWLAVARLVAEKVPNATFHIAGTGREQQRLENLARELHIVDRVTFHGQIPYDHLPQFYRRHSVFLIASRNEAFGRVIVEAMAFGLPIVATRFPGALDIIEHETTGFVEKHDDIEGMAERVCSLLNDKSLRSIMGGAAHTAAIRDYAPMAASERWVDFMIETAKRESIRTTKRLRQSFGSTD